VSQKSRTLLIRPLRSAHPQIFQKSQKFLSDLPPEQRLAGLNDEVIQKFLSGLPPEQRLAGLDPEQRLAGLDPEQRLAGLDPEQRLAGLDPEQVVLALPDAVLRGLSTEFLAALSEPVRGAIRRRLNP
jgi:hypothetical protein